MRIAVLGAGGVGGVFGGVLSRAGHDVIFLARGPHLAAMQRQGLRVLSPHGDFVIHPAQATDSTSSLAPVEYVIVAVKHHQLRAAAASLGALVAEGTTVVPLSNGIDVHEILAEVIGPQSVIGGLCNIVARIESPGVIRQESRIQRVVIGELDHRPSDRVRRIVNAWREAGVEAIEAEDIHLALWRKFLFIASFAGVSSLSRANAGQILTCEPARQLLAQAMEEVAALAQRREIGLPATAVQEAMALLESFEPTATSSMQRDVADGRPFELEAFSGAILRLARQHGLPTPVHAALYALLRPALDRALAAS
ncbi:MAG: 2-dehydropantoate 2-reductase [Chloroflexota bacterium]